jgi:hypothetical protein
MHYWNKANFDGLARLSEELEVHPNLRSLASYCRLREKGLRREAMATLELFLTASQSFDKATARSSAVQILELNEQAREAHQFLTQPLISRFLVPTLQAWSDDEPKASVPVRWLGMLFRDSDLLTKALVMCPEDLPVRKLLIERNISHAEHATHHLDESYFIGSFDDAAVALECAKDLISNAPDPEQVVYLTSEVNYFDELLADWKAYSEDLAGTFPEWCAKRGRRYGYPIKIYYQR